MIDKKYTFRTSHWSNANPSPPLDNVDFKKLHLIFQAFSAMGFSLEGPDVKGNQLFGQFPYSSYVYDRRDPVPNPSKPGYYFGASRQFGPLVMYIFNTRYSWTYNNGNTFNTVIKAGLYLCHRKGNAIYNFGDPTNAFYSSIKSSSSYLPAVGDKPSVVVNHYELTVRVIKTKHTTIMFANNDPCRHYILITDNVDLADVLERFNIETDEEQSNNEEGKETGTDLQEGDPDDTEKDEEKKKTWVVYAPMIRDNNAKPPWIFTWEYYASTDPFIRTGILRDKSKNEKLVISYPVILKRPDSIIDGSSQKRGSEINKQWEGKIPGPLLCKSLYKHNNPHLLPIRQFTLEDGDFLTLPAHFDTDTYSILNPESQLYDGLCVLLNVDDEEEDDISDQEEDIDYEKETFEEMEEVP